MKRGLKEIKEMLGIEQKAKSTVGKELYKIADGFSKEGKKVAG